MRQLWLQFEGDRGSFWLALFLRESHCETATIGKRQDLTSILLNEEKSIAQNGTGLKTGENMKGVQQTAKVDIGFMIPAAQLNNHRLKPVGWNYGLKVRIRVG